MPDSNAIENPQDEVQPQNTSSEEPTALELPALDEAIPQDGGEEEEKYLKLAESFATEFEEMLKAKNLEVGFAVTIDPTGRPITYAMGGTYVLARLTDQIAKHYYLLLTKPFGRTEEPR